MLLTTFKRPRKISRSSSTRRPAYAQQVVPEARGRAQRQLEEAQGYRDRVIARSEGEAQRFEKLLAEYSAAKQVTRDRLYIDAMERVFANSSKVMIDVEGGNNMMYLPSRQARAVKFLRR